MMVVAARRARLRLFLLLYLRPLSPPLRVVLLLPTLLLPWRPSSGRVSSAAVQQKEVAIISRFEPFCR